MKFLRTKLIEKFNESFNSSGKQYVVIVWEKGIGKSAFLSLLEESDIFVTYKTESILISDDSPLDSTELKNPDTNLIILDSTIPVSFSEIRSFIESKSPDSRVIFTSEVLIFEDTVDNFPVSGISFREYAEWAGNPIDVWAIMSKKADIWGLNELRDTYIHLGQYPCNLDNPEWFQLSFDEKLATMNQELFKKEEWDFLDFIRTLAMNVGDIYKEERIAKNMNISRRKVRKYTEIALKHNLIRAVGPWVENTITELSRHVKVYFTDLSYFHAALGVSYYHGEGKQGVMENFILIEIERKLSATHDIRFYRKKSGSEVSFVLVEKKSEKITPIEVTIKSSNIIPQSLKSFHESYGSRIEHAMIMNDNISEQKDLDWTPIIILPHIAI